MSKDQDSQLIWESFQNRDGQDTDPRSKVVNMFNDLFAQKQEHYPEADASDLYDAAVEDLESEFNEQDEGGGETTGGDSSSTNSNTSTWETGLTRGPANQLTITVWNPNLGRGKANMIDQNSKWESGISRGKSNKLN